MHTRTPAIALMGMLLALVLSACAPATTPTPTLPAPTEPLPTFAAPTIATTPTLVPVVLAGPQAGAQMAWVDGGVLVYVPAGEFGMGSGAANATQRTVSLSEYWIYQTEVTNAMYAFCVSAGACAPPAQELGTPLYDNLLYANYPVVGTTWDMAANYCAWIGGSLPSEAQWEKAARGSGGNTYPWGSLPEASCALGNFAGCIDATTDVTRYGDGASPYGALDMAGNVFEWVNDFYGENYYTSAPAQDPPGPDSGQYRVIRGSSFETDTEQAAVATRHFGGNAFHDRQTGFRCVVPQPAALAPMCQTSSYLPSALVGEGECQPPEAAVDAAYCESKVPYTTIDIPMGAEWSVSTVDHFCEEAVIDGQRRLTCSGPDASTGELVVCNAACSGLSEVTGAEPSCDPGYGLDAGSSTCLYSPVSPEPGVTGCAEGFTLIERGDTRTCAPGLGGEGLCPVGTYLDGSYGACVSPSGGADLPVGLNKPELAAQSYQGCLPGFSYSDEFQCCQPSQGGVYPGCPLGTRYDAAEGTCIPGQLRLSGPGCVTVSFNMAQCTEPFQISICAKIKTEVACIKNQVYDCKWFESKGACEYVK